MALRLRVLVKVVMVMAIILWVWHLASNKLRSEEEEEIQKERGIKKSMNKEDVTRSDTAGDTEIAVQGHVENEKNGSPLILLWNNYQDDKIALYTKIFHR